MPLFRRNTEKNSKMCKRDGVTFKVTPPFFKDFYSYFNHKKYQINIFFVIWLQLILVRNIKAKG